MGRPCCCVRACRLCVVSFALYIVDRICARSVRSGARVAAAADADAVVTPEATAAVATVEAAS